MVVWSLGAGRLEALHGTQQSACTQGGCASKEALHHLNGDMMNRAALEYQVRAYESADEAAVLGLMRDALGWGDDERYATLFRWKHAMNPWGPSPAWVTVAPEGIVGYRAFMRWRFVVNGRTVDAVRAVDTATHSEHRGAGIFRRMTLHGLEELRRERIAFVFNTPNHQSRPGYVKMGWRVVGRLPVAVTPCHLGGATRMLRARTSAARWSLPIGVGVPASLFLQEHAIALSAMDTANSGVSTDRSAAYLMWRYCVPELDYRVITLGGRVDDGALVMRVRQRGAAIEGVVDDVIVPDGNGRAVHHLVAAARRGRGVDYLIGLGSAPTVHRPSVPLPRQGPLLTWRQVTEDEPPLLPDWRLSLGDIELF